MTWFSSVLILPVSSACFDSPITDLLYYFLILLFVYIRQFLSSLFCVSHFIFHLFLKSMYSGIWWGAQSRCYKFTSVLFQKIVLKWCFSTLKYPSFLVLLCWKIFFAVLFYYLSSNENLDLLTSYLLRSRECITSQPLFYLPDEKPFSRPHARGQIDVQDPIKWGMGKKSPSPGKFMPWSPSICWGEWPQLSLAFCCPALHTVYLVSLSRPPFWCYPLARENNHWYSDRILLYYCIVYSVSICINLTTSQGSHNSMYQPSEKKKF